jgi:hypothetical protein
MIRYLRCNRRTRGIVAVLDLPNRRTKVTGRPTETRSVMKETALRYEIQIQSQLAPHRLRHFESLMIHQESSGDTMIVGFFRANA